MSVLNLFPSRIRFVNPDGTLTEPALRMLDVVVERLGGALGDIGIDVFAMPETSYAGDAPVVAQPLPPNALTLEMVMQPTTGAGQPSDVVQQPLDYSAGTGLSLTNMRFVLKDTAVTPGTYGNATNFAQFTVDQQGRITNAQNVPTNGVSFSGSFTGKTVTVVNGIITSVV